MPAQDTSLVIMHYHLKPGGVTSVVRDDLKALLRYADWLGPVRLVVGSHEALDSFRANIEPELKGHTLEITVLRELDYTEGCSETEQSEALHRALTGFLNENSVWWIHNYHLGKNPVFTEVLLHLIARHPEQRVLLQIHDFAECGRYQNLESLRTCITTDPYPTAANVRYITINGRDHRLLLSAGIPDRQVWTLHNPAPVRGELQGAEAADRPSIRAALADTFGGHAGRFDPKLPMAIYPVRTIRRKNAFESLLLARVSPAEHNLLLTLPGVSQPEQRYSQLVQAAFRKGFVPGLWGIGDRLVQAGLGFDHLVGACELIVSASVQEGFGYQFVTALTHAVPLFARRLEVLTGTDRLFDRFPSYFYNEVRVPWHSRHEPELHAETARSYERRIASAAAILPASARERLHAELTALVSAETAEFSYLAPRHQYRILEEVANDHGCRREVFQLNSALCEHIGRLLNTPVNGEHHARVTKLADWFGLESVARGIAIVIDSFDTRSGKPPAQREFDAPSQLTTIAECAAIRRFATPEVHPLPGNSVQERLIYAFSRLENLRLLYD